MAWWIFPKKEYVIILPRKKEELVIAQANAAIDDDGKFTNKWVKARKDADFPLSSRRGRRFD